MAAGVKAQLKEASMLFIARRALAVVLLMIASMAAWAQGYPDRPLRLVVGFPPGGSGDFLARIIAEELTREIGQPVVVDNKPGAGSNIAAEHVARAAPDGHTILLAGNFSHAINPWLYKLSWDPHRDFTPITEVAVMSIIVCIAPQHGIRSMKELIAKVRSEPGKWFYASPGNGTSQHLAGAELNRLAGIDMQHVPFKGGAPSLQAVLVGDLGAAPGAARGEAAPVRGHHQGHAPAAGRGEACARGDGARDLRLARGVRRVRAQGPRLLRGHRQGLWCEGGVTRERGSAAHRCN